MFRSNLTKLAMPAVATAVLLAPAGLALACSPSPSPSPVPCTVRADGTANTYNQPDSKFTMSGDEVTGKVIVTGDGKCTVTITTWTAPNPTDGKPYNEQKVFDHTTESFTAGEHTISTKMPDCDYQVDLLRGSEATENGTPLYDAGDLMGSLHGGASACGQGVGTPTPTPTPSSTPVPTSTPVVTPSPSPAPQVLSASTLPDTGSATSGVVGLGSMISAGYTYIRARRRMRG